jgi:glutamyl-tRNA reductase
VARGIEHLTAVNRTFAHAEALAEDLGGSTRRYEELAEAIGDADIVVAATSAPSAVVSRAVMEQALRHRHERLAEGPLLVFDIAVPRDVEPVARELDGLVYRDIDDLQAISEANGAARRDEVEAVQALVDTEARRFAQWWGQLGVLPTVAALSERAEAMRAAQVERTLQALGGRADSEELRVQLDALTRSLVRQLLHDPITTLRRRGDRDDYVAAARMLFGLDEVADEDEGVTERPEA